MRTSRTLSQRSVALRVLGLGSVSTLMLGALGCSGTPGIAGTEDVRSASAAISPGALDTTFNGTGELVSQNSTYDGNEQYNDVKVQRKFSPTASSSPLGSLCITSSLLPPRRMETRR
jgi:hypothetical protein